MWALDDGTVSSAFVRFFQGNLLRAFFVFVFHEVGLVVVFSVEIALCRCSPLGAWMVVNTDFTRSLQVDRVLEGMARVYYVLDGCGR
jgi:hypothetical protein